MKTVKALIAEVDAELNAVKAADMGLEAAEAFGAETQRLYASGDVLKAKEALDNLVSLLSALRKAVPANVVAASAGPVGKSPREHYIEAAAKSAEECIERLAKTLAPIRETLVQISEAVDQASRAAAEAKALPKDEATA